MDRPGSEAWRLDRAARLIAFSAGSALPDGGFGWLGADGSVDPAKPRPLYINARMTYAFTLAYLDGDLRAGELAAAGIASLLDRYADREHGGWYASLDAGGQVSDPTKANYAHAHMVLASSTAVAAGLPRAHDALAHAVDAVNAHFWSEAEGCALEDWDREFTTTEQYRGANSNMHSVEAYLVAGDVTGDDVWRQRALSIAQRLIDTHARENAWRIPEHYDAAWRPVLDYNADRKDDQFRPYGTTPGHSFEWARLLVVLEAGLDDPPHWLLEAAVGLFDVAAAKGWAPDGHDGFVYTLDYDDRPIVKQRLHWVACEAVLAADFLHRRTGQARYAELADTWWQHIAEHFLDGERGGWWQELTPTLEPASSIWSGKPDAYHSYQVLRFPSLPIAPCAALTLS